MRRFILITGASSGIGESACHLLLEKGYEIIAGVRSIADATKLKTAGGPSLHPLIMDVTDEIGMKTARDEAVTIIGNGTLVAIFNNAGIVVYGAWLYIPIDKWQQQFEVNVIGVIRTTQLFFPLLSVPRQNGDTHPRRVINMGSVSGLFASPFIAPYAASKYALEALSDSLRRELYMYDIQVVIIEAGNIATPIWKKAKQTPSYFGAEYDTILAFKDQMIDGLIAKGMPLKAVNDVVIKTVMAKTVKTRYLVRPQKWKFNFIRLLPTKWVDRLIHRNLQKRSGIRPF
ncbi:MAG: SDR family NAD(P)-dependent oxidoreductase [Saprospiraceae bacterium]|nr:SDR family NAD(P)-dependent oxidoreductase [Saprospiraceae bacterium]